MKTLSASLSVDETQFELDRFLDRVGQAPRSALLLDYDGTLAPFTVNRRQAFAYGGVIPRLREIMAGGWTRLVVITGRDAREVIGLLGIDPPPEVWGSHGSQRLRPDGTCTMPVVDDSAAHALAEAGNWLEWLKLRHMAEMKPGGIAVHWRGIPDARADEIRDQVLRGWFSIAQEGALSLLEFDGGVEMRLPHFDKGDAVRVLLGEMGPDVPVAYLGDDMTDEHAFEALGPRGLTVLVRPEWRKTAAQFWLKPPEGLLDFLARWAGRKGPIHKDNELQTTGGR
jgi:trehalose-phosphatase